MNDNYPIFNNCYIEGNAVEITSSFLWSSHVLLFIIFHFIIWYLVRIYLLLHFKTNGISFVVSLQRRSLLVSIFIMFVFFRYHFIWYCTAFHCLFGTKSEVESADVSRFPRIKHLIQSMSFLVITLKILMSIIKIITNPISLNWFGRCVPEITAKNIAITEYVMVPNRMILPVSFSRSRMLSIKLIKCVTRKLRKYPLIP